MLSQVRFTHERRTTAHRYGPLSTAMTRTTRATPRTHAVRTKNPCSRSPRTIWATWGLWAPLASVLCSWSVTRLSTIISRDTPAASWSTVRRRLTDSHRLRAIRTIVTRGRARVNRSKAFTPRWTCARSADLTRVIWPKSLGRVTPRALDSLVTACWGGSALVMAGRVTGLPAKLEARPDAFPRAWLMRGTVLRTM